MPTYAKTIYEEIWHFRMELQLSVASDAVLGEEATKASLQETVRKTLSFFLNIKYLATSSIVNLLSYVWIFLLWNKFFLQHVGLNSNIVCITVHVIPFIYCPRILGKSHRSNCICWGISKPMFPHLTEKVPTFPCYSNFVV